MTFDPNIYRDAPPFIHCLCKSLYYENLLVRLPDRAVVCHDGMTPAGRIGRIDLDNPEVSLAGLLFAPDTLKTEELADYETQVGQEDPDAVGPGFDRNWWAWAVAAFRYAGGIKPESPKGAEGWTVLHLYHMDLIQVDKHRYHFTQSANLVAVHPVAQHLLAEQPCLLKSLQKRVFDKFGYDPLGQIAPGQNHDERTGFAVNNA